MLFETVFLIFGKLNDIQIWGLLIKTRLLEMNTLEGNKHTGDTQL